MRTPGARAAGAVMVLAAYYWLLIATPFARPGDDAEARLRADLESSRIAFEARRFAEALAPTERLTTELSSQAVYHERLARILKELDRPADEARAWERMMAVTPTPIDACPMIAEAYQRAGRADAALAAIERCAALPPVNPDFLVLQGQALLQMGRPADARRAFERGLAIDQSYPDLHLLLGIRQLDDGELPEARDSFARFLELAPGRRAEVEVWLQRVGKAK